MEPKTKPTKNYPTRPFGNEIEFPPEVIKAIKEMEKSNKKSKT